MYFIFSCSSILLPHSNRRFPFVCFLTEHLGEGSSLSFTFGYTLPTQSYVQRIIPNTKNCFSKKRYCRSPCSGCCSKCAGKEKRIRTKNYYEREREIASPRHWKCEWQLFQEVYHSKEYKYALLLHFFMAYDIWSMDVEKLTSFLLNGNRCSLNP